MGIAQLKTNLNNLLPNGIRKLLCHQSYCSNVVSLFFFASTRCLDGHRFGVVRSRINFHVKLHTTSDFINEWLMSNALESNQRMDAKNELCETQSSAAML